MPLTFIDIERSKSWRISILFIVLLILYFCVSFAFFHGYFLLVSLFSKSPYKWLGGSPWNLLYITVFSLMIAAIHFLISGYNAVRFVVHNLNVLPPDPEDGIHARLLNVAHELNIASGSKRTIECLVIPTLSLNALAVTDLRGQAVIAITEGLLSRLSRPQLEAVLAHEAYHILSGDCLETTMATSLFGMYASGIEKIEALSDEEFIGIHPVFLLFWVLLKLSFLLSMFISREREYRADAASLRITRNPIAMAEALLVISRNWSGSGIIGSGLEMLCLVSPNARAFDDGEGWLAQLLSTHPPMKKRIEILLRMAHMQIGDFLRKQKIEGNTTTSFEHDEHLTYVLDESQQWQGPYTLYELASLHWLTPHMWLASAENLTITRAADHPAAHNIFRHPPHEPAYISSEFSCPSCRQKLVSIPYEKTSVLQCRSCGGTLVENIKIPRIIARRQRPCTERVRSLARAIINDNQRMLAIQKLRGKRTNVGSGLLCTKCGHPMHRAFYSLAYLIEIDRCNLCGVTWFDRDELEMLQCIIENKIMPKIVS